MDPIEDFSCKSLDVTVYVVKNGISKMAVFRYRQSHVDISAALRGRSTTWSEHGDPTNRFKKSPASRIT